MTTPPTPAEVAEARAYFRRYEFEIDDLAQGWRNQRHAAVLVRYALACGERAALAAPAEQPREIGVFDVPGSAPLGAPASSNTPTPVSPSAVPAVSDTSPSAGGAGRDLTAADVRDALDAHADAGSLTAFEVADYLNGIARPVTATAPTTSELRATLREIADTATEGDGILQPGAAYALGMLADLVRAQPGCLPEHVADAIAATAVSADTGTQATEQTTEYRAAVEGEQTGTYQDRLNEVREFVADRKARGQAYRVESRTVTTSVSPWSPVDVHDEEVGS